MTDRQLVAMRAMLASDDSAAARSAEDWLARVRWKLPPEIDVVSVAQRPISYLGWTPELSPASRRRALGSLRRAELDRAQRMANEVGERLQAAGLVVRSWAREGDPAEALLDAIQESEPDLVAVGPGNRSTIARFFVGSVSRRLIEGANLPILVARGVAAAEGPLPRQVAVLVGALVGGRPAVTAAVRWLARAGWLSGTPVRLVGFVGALAGVDADEQLLADEFFQARREEATAMLDRLAGELPPDVGDVTFDLLPGDPFEASLALLASGELDLVVVSRIPVLRGTASFGERVAAEAPVSVLLVPAAPAGLA